MYMGKITTACSFETKRFMKCIKSFENNTILVCRFHTSLHSILVLSGLIKPTSDSPGQLNNVFGLLKFNVSRTIGQVKLSADA